MTNIDKLRVALESILSTPAEPLPEGEAFGMAAFRALKACHVIAHEALASAVFNDDKLAHGIDSTDKLRVALELLDEAYRFISPNYDPSPLSNTQMAAKIREALSTLSPSTMETETTADDIDEYRRQIDKINGAIRKPAPVPDPQDKARELREQLIDESARKIHAREHGFLANDSYPRDNAALTRIRYELGLFADLILSALRKGGRDAAAEIERLRNALDEYACLGRKDCSAEKLKDGTCIRALTGCCGDLAFRALYGDQRQPVQAKSSVMEPGQISSMLGRKLQGGWD